MLQPGNINNIEGNTATGALTSNTSLNAAVKNSKSALKVDNTAWKYKGFLAQTAFKKRIKSTLWKKATVFKDLNFVIPVVGTLKKLWNSVTTR